VKARPIYSAPISALMTDAGLGSHAVMRARHSLVCLLGLVLATLMLCAAELRAQTPPVLPLPGQAPAQSSEEGGGGDATAPPSEAEINELIKTLQDEDQRQALIDRLQTLLAAEGKPAQEEAPVTEDIVGWLLGEISARTAVVRNVAEALTGGFDRFPDLLKWLRSQLLDPTMRAVWLGVGVRVACVLGIGALALGAAAWFLGGVRARLVPDQPLGYLARLPRALLLLVVELLPIVAFMIGTYAALSLFSVHDRTWRVVLPLINAVIVVRAGVALVKVLFAPKAPTLRLLPMPDDAAAYAARWSRRLLATAAYGYAILLAARHLGLPWTLQGLLLHILFLSLVVMFIVVIAQTREPIAAIIARLEEEPHSPTLRRLPWRSLASIWHVLATVYVVFIFLVWALRIPGGFRTLLEATLGSALIVTGGWLGWRALDHVFKRELRIAGDGDRLMTGFERRISRYWPALGVLARVLLLALVALGLLEVWGLGTLSWLFSSAGNLVIGHLLTVSVIILITLALWELISFLIERSVSEQDEEGELKLSNRTRTLLNIVRNFVLVFLSVIALFLILSELGLNVAPLLAGAGVIGLAIGFGSQKLVQDITTGMFVLMGDTMRVGDVVEVAGRSGVVEQMSLRTVALRDLAGAMHTIPYSAIDTVMNYTKDFSYAVIDMGIAYRENVDEVIEVLRLLGEEMNKDPHFRRAILEPLEILGVDAFTDSAVMIKIRFKTRPLKQWEVAREFRRRIKNRFDQLGIEIPYPHRTVYFGSDREGQAMPARIQMLQANMTPATTGSEADQKPQPAQPILARSRGG
jgi:small-conductance mechanosensitive channel